MAVLLESLSETEPRQRPSLTLLICDQVGLNAAIRIAARRKVIRIFADAGIDVMWVEVVRNFDGCGIPGQHSSLTVVVQDDIPKTYRGSVHVLGLAVTRTGPFRRAYVFFDRVRQVVKNYRSDEEREPLGILLGNGIAHEVGHLLSGEAHGLGIMRAKWSTKEWYAAMGSGLTFHPLEADKLRRELLQQ